MSIPIVPLIYRHVGFVKHEYTNH